MPVVLRHAVDQATARDEVETLTARLGDPMPPKTSLHVAMVLLQFRTVLDPAAAQAETWQALRTAAETATAVVTTGTDGNAGLWLTAAWLAVVDRNDELIRQLCAVSPEALRALDADYDDYMFPWVETVQRFLSRREIGPDLFLAVMDGTDPDTVRFIPPRLMLDVIYPPIKMFYYVLRRDPAKFTEAAVGALENHRRSWAANEADPNGFLALAPLAIAVLARSAGLAVDVASDYWPKNFLLGVRPSPS